MADEQPNNQRSWADVPDDHWVDVPGAGFVPGWAVNGSRNSPPPSEHERGWALGHMAGQQEGYEAGQRQVLDFLRANSDTARRLADEYERQAAARIAEGNTDRG